MNASILETKSFTYRSILKDLFSQGHSTSCLVQILPVLFGVKSGQMPIFAHNHSEVFFFIIDSTITQVAMYLDV